MLRVTAFLLAAVGALFPRIVHCFVVVDARTRVLTLPARQQCTQSAAVRTTAAPENAAAAAAPAALLAPASPTTSLSTVTLLIQMMGKRVDASAFKYADVQIEEKIKQHKIDLKKSCPDTGMLPLRAAIRLGRRDVCKVLLRHGACPMASESDDVGPVIFEVVRSDRPGALHMLTELLEALPPAAIRTVTSEAEADGQRLRVTQRYWLRRGLKHALPPARLAALDLARLNALKYRIVGQLFALEQVLGEVSSFHVNAELSEKPLVMLFSGPPGHGKTETAKQLADLLGCPFHKVDCRNHATPWEMFGSGVGYVGSTVGTQLSNFIAEQAGRRSVVLLDEFDHCSVETWEGFYHIFDEGTFTDKKAGAFASSFSPGGSDNASGGTGSGSGSGSGGGGATRQVSCSKTIWLLTTNRFDADIAAFNARHHEAIEAYRRGEVPFDDLHDTFDAFIRPKLRHFFQGGLTRRIDAIVPFFKFDAEEAHVVADMHLDRLRESYARPATADRKVGTLRFAVTDHAVGELSRSYGLHQWDGASAIKREVYQRVIKKLHMQWIKQEGAFAVEHEEGDPPGGAAPEVWVHHSATEGFHQLFDGAITDEQKQQLPYFVGGEGRRPLVAVEAATLGAAAPLAEAAAMAAAAAAAASADEMEEQWATVRAEEVQMLQLRQRQQQKPRVTEAMAAFAATERVFGAPAHTEEPTRAPAAEESVSSSLAFADRAAQASVSPEVVVTAASPVGAGVCRDVKVSLDGSSGGIYIANFFEAHSIDTTAADATIGRVCTLLREAVVAEFLEANSVPMDVRAWTRVSHRGAAADKPLSVDDWAMGTSVASGDSALDAECRSRAPGPFGPGSRMVTVEHTDVTDGWRLIRDSEFNAPLATFLPKHGGTFELYFESKPRDADDREWPRHGDLSRWREELAPGDVVDVNVGALLRDEATFMRLHNDGNAQSTKSDELDAVPHDDDSSSSSSYRDEWVEGRVTRVGPRSVGFGAKPLRLQLYVGAESDVAELLKKKVERSVGFPPGTPQEPAHLEVVVREHSSAVLQPLYSFSPRWRVGLAAGHEVLVRLQPGVWVEGTVVADPSTADAEADTVLIQLESAKGGGGGAPMFVRLSRYSDELATTFVSLARDTHPN